MDEKERHKKHLEEGKTYNKDYKSWSSSRHYQMGFFDKLREEKNEQKRTPNLFTIDIDSCTFRDNNVLVRISKGDNDIFVNWSFLVRMFGA